MASVQTLTTRFEAQIIQFDAQMRRLQQLNSTALNRVQSAHTNAQSTIARSWQRSNLGQAVQQSLGVQGINQQMGSLAAGMVGALGIGAVSTAVSGAADAYTRFTNSLKVAGMEGLALARIQDDLYESAVRNGVGLESLGELYGSITTATRDLGVSQSQILTVTNAVSDAIRVAGTSTQAASGAITQLGQLLGSEKVAAEEYNSVKEGLRPLLQAAAEASAKYGGSVSKLTAEVKKGKVTNAEFFKLIEDGAKILEERAAKAPLTLAAGIQNLSTAFTKYVGEQNAALSATTTLTGALSAMAENMDLVLESLITIAVYAGSVYVAAMAKAGGAAVASAIQQAMAQRSLALAMAGTTTAAGRLAAFQNTMTASMTRSTVSARVLAGSMKALSSSFGIGLLIMGVATAIMAVHDAMGANERSVASLKAATADYNEIMADANELMGEAEGATNGYSSQNSNAIDPTYALCDANQQLAGSYLEVANAAYAAIQARLADRIDANNARINEIDNPGAVGKFGRGLNAIGYAWSGMLGGGPQQFTNARNALDGNNAEDAERERLRNQNADMMAQMIGITLDDRAWVPDGRGGGGSEDKKKGSGRSPREIDYRDEEAIHAQNMTMLAIQIARAASMAERHTLEQQQADAEYAQAVKAMEADERLTEPAKAALKLSMAAVKVHEDQLRLSEQQREVMEHELQLAQSRIDHQSNMASSEAERLNILAGIAETEAERWRLEDEAIAVRRANERAVSTAEIAGLEARLRLAKTLEERALIEEEITRKKVEAADREVTYGVEDRARGSDRRTNLQRYASEVMNEKFDFGDTAEKGLRSLESALNDVANGTKTLQEAFADVAKSIVADIMRVVIRAMIMKAILAMIPGLAAPSIGFGGTPIPADLNGLYASGTNFSKSGLALVGEKGPEIVGLGLGSKVMPTNVLSAAVGAGKSGRQSGNTTIVNNVNMNAKDAVLTQTVKQWVHEGMTQAVNASRMMIPQEMNRGGRQRL